MSWYYTNVGLGHVCCMRNCRQCVLQIETGHQPNVVFLCSSVSLSLSLFPFPEDQRHHSHLLVHSARGVGFSETFLFTRSRISRPGIRIKPRTMDSTSSSNSNAPHHRAILSSRHRHALTTTGNIMIIIENLLSNVCKQPTHPANTARPVRPRPSDCTTVCSPRRSPLHSATLSAAALAHRARGSALR